MLFSDTCFTAQALVRLFVDLHEKSLEVVGQGFAVVDEPKFDDVMATFILLADKIADCRQLLEVSGIRCYGSPCGLIRLVKLNL